MERKKILISRALRLEIWNMQALSEGHQNYGLSWKYMSKQLIMLRFYHETFALAPKLWCRHIYFYLFVGGGGYLSAPACLCSFFNHDNTPIIFQENTNTNNIVLTLFYPAYFIPHNTWGWGGPRKNLPFEIHFTHLYFRFHRIWQNCRFASWILGYTSLRFWFHKSAKVTFIERISREAPPLVFLVFIFCPCTRTLVTFQDGLEIFLCQQAWALETVLFLFFTFI